MFDETLVPRPDVLEQLASQKTNVEGGDLKRSERHVVFMTFPNMSQVLVPEVLIGGAAKEERQRGDGGREAEAEEGMAAAVTAGRREEDLREDGGRGEGERAAAVGSEEELKKS